MSSISGLLALIPSSSISGCTKIDNNFKLEDLRCAVDKVNKLEEDYAKELFKSLGGDWDSGEVLFIPPSLKGVISTHHKRIDTSTLVDRPVFVKCSPRGTRLRNGNYLVDNMLASKKLPKVVIRGDLV